MTKAKTVSVVIPNYNGRKLLAEYLPSVFAALKYANVEHEIIIPDDASSDDSVDFLKKNYPEINIIVGKKNLGFSANINRGLREATKELVLALNSDVQLREDYFVAQLPYFEDPNIFGTMGALHDFGKAVPIQLDLYPVQNFWGLIRSVRIPNYEFSEPTAIYFLSGSNALMDREKLQKLSFFNEVYSPFYGEDADLGLRAWRMGWTSIYVPQSVCYHRSSSTISRFNKKKRVRTISRRNKILFHMAHLTGFSKWKFKIKILLDLLTRWIVLDTGFYQAFFQFIKLYQQMNQFMEQQKFVLSTEDAVNLVKEKMKKEL